MKKPIEDNTEDQIITFQIDKKRPYEQITKNKFFSQSQYKELLTNIQKDIKKQNNYGDKQYLQNLKNLLKARKSMSKSEDFVNKFSKSNLKSAKLGKYFMMKPELNFRKIDQQIKNTTKNFFKKKFYLNQSHVMFKSTEKRRRRINVQLSQLQFSKGKTYQEILIAEKTKFLKEFMTEDELLQFQNQINSKIQNTIKAENQSLSDKMISFIISHMTIEKVLEMMCQNTQNIKIKQNHFQQYMKIKEQMVSISINEAEIIKYIHNLQKFTHLEKENIKTAKKLKTLNNSTQKKAFYSAQRQNNQFFAQIQEVMENTKKALKEAFMKKNRPDFVYEMQLALGGRKTPLMKTRSK